MTSTRITPARLGFAAGAALLTTFAMGTPVFATNEFPPYATVTATSGCEGDTFHLHTSMSNPGGLDVANFVVTATDVYGPITVNKAVDVAPNETSNNDWKFFEGVSGTVHITSDDNNPVVDYVFTITPDCVPEVTTTIPATTIPATTMPATTMPATTIPAPATTVAVFAPDSLPSTGSSSPILVALAAGLLGVGILMRRATRQTN